MERPMLANESQTPDWYLAAVFEVDREHRVQCQCKGCGRSVYRRVHMIVRHGDDVECWGSRCYRKELGGTADTHGITARYTSGGGRAADRRRA
jgi:hypothetical protein